MVSTTAQALGEVIRLRRLAKNVTQEVLGKQAGYKSGAGVSISRIESGAVRPRPERLRGIAEALSTTAAALEGEAGLAGAAVDGSAAVRQLKTIKERRTGVEAQFLERSRTLSQVEVTYFAAAKRAVDDLAMPFGAICYEFEDLPATPEGPTSPRLVDGEPGWWVRRMKARPDWTSADDGTIAEDALGAAVTSGALDAVGRRGADSLFAAVSKHGKASTGIPIRNLRGVARSNAATARLGFGAREAGGFGMTGGRAVLSTVAVLPTVIALGGVFAIALIKSRRDQELKVCAAEEFLDLTEERFEAVIEHMTESTEILETATTHGSWSFEAWQESLTSPSGKLLRAWLELDDSQRSRCRDLMQVTECLTDLIALAPEELLIAPSARLPTIGELTFGDAQIGRSTDELAPGQRGGDFGEAPERFTDSSYEQVEERYREVRKSTRKAIRASLGRRG